MQTLWTVQQQKTPAARYGQRVILKISAISVVSNGSTVK
jgi:hypothetical protein